MASRLPASAASSAQGGAPHALSLKVLRLSRPSLATQTPLPGTTFGNGLDIPPIASLAYPPTNDNDLTSFPLTPLLTLPSAFGAAFVGETFTCTLCVNNEIAQDEAGSRRSVSAVKVIAELQTPGQQQGVALPLSSASANSEEDENEDTSSAEDLPPGTTLQQTLRHELKEEGPHVLAVTVTYTETTHNNSDDGGGASGGRVRSFRKLYQFVAQQLIAVRSKITPRKSGEKGGRQWVLEAQLENVGEATAAVVERVWLEGKEGLACREVGGRGEGESVGVLKPGDVEQVMFLVREEQELEGGGDGGVGRMELAKLCVDWRGPMGEKGSLTTGWLAWKGR
ncbi:hypothetical protein LTR62_005603 [Meristemomyces frigidus]|uniref:Trafficking protein particle complex subunit 13 n=1 Tax=Meristemomyces frigidus TaxID=1508187 RepID=A0AAN7YQK8_9PEZI|nr:hypothetical protein LTR62_005603 [Meristemomyces frigidus]